MSKFLENNFLYAEIIDNSKFVSIVPCLKKLFQKNGFHFFTKEKLNRIETIFKNSNYRPCVFMKDEIVECNFRMIESYLPELLFLLSYNSNPKEPIHSIINRLAASEFPYADVQHSKQYLCHKVICLLETMLFADIFGKVWKGEIASDKVYVYKDGTELRYYHYYQVRPFLFNLLDNIAIKCVTTQSDPMALNVEFVYLRPATTLST